MRGSYINPLLSLCVHVAQNCVKLYFFGSKIPIRLYTISEGPFSCPKMSSHRTYSSSAPKYDTQRPGRTYASPTPESYHGRQFVNAGAQEQYWNSRGSTEVWDPSKPLSSVAARPDTYGLAHSYHESTMEHEYSDPYKKRPNPYTARTKADYDVYKRPSEGHGGIAEEVRRYKDTPVGRKTSPHDYHRDNLIKGKNLAKEGRDMANM